MLLAARWHPAQRFFLGGPALHERGLGQGFFHLHQIRLPAGGNAVHDHVLEHGNPSLRCLTGGNCRRWRGPRRPTRPSGSPRRTLKISTACSNCYQFNSCLRFHGLAWRHFWQKTVAAPPARRTPRLVTTLHRLQSCSRRRYMGGAHWLQPLQRSLWRRTSPPVKGLIP